MGNKLGRIEREFVLRKMEEEHVELDLHGERKNGRAAVLSLSDDDDLVVRMIEEPEPPFSRGDPVRLFFSFFDHVMSFEGSFRDVGEHPKISVPDTLIKNLERKFERVEPSGRAVHLSFELESSRIELDYPRATMFHAEEENGELLYSSRFDGDSIQNLLKQFHTSISAYAESSHIQMFRERRPEGFAEQVVASTGLALFIPDTSSFFPSTEEADGRPVLVEELLPGEEGEAFYGKSLDELRSWIREEGRSGVLSLLHLPICYQDYVIGIISLKTGIGRGVAFDNEVFDICREFSQVLVHVLESGGYFAGASRQRSAYKPQIINISASGLLFTHSSSELSSQIGVYSDIELLLSIESRPMTISSRVMRKYHEGDHIYYGLQFMELKPEDFRYLFEAVYGRSFTERDDRLWEGGAKPPDLIL